ncbi:hypothetical protein WJX72_001842 [[Myrmecia] bisecta]|uniref:AAA+ ATPase domain-containing protein n=1 Tax=[Myrmecia] bisecta TaxID=41462 RepID=A0AAW1NYB8_9CHLO
MNRVDTVLTSLPMWARQRQLQKLQAAYEADPTSTDKFLAYLQALNKSKPAEVIKQVDSHKFNASPAVMVEYFRALVATDRIAEYADESGTGAGESHRSLSQLMKDVQTRVDGEDGAEAPGQSIKRPLHIVLQEAQRKPSNFFVDLVRGLAWYLLTFLLLSVFFLLGSGLARRYAGAGLRPAGMASQIGTPATPSFAPKEYNKIGTPATPSFAPKEYNKIGMPATPSFAPKEYNKEDIPEKSQKTFKDVRGCDEAKAELEEIVEYLKHPEKFTRLGGKLPKGVLLTGPPGTGKTLLAKAVAGEAGVPFFFRAGSEFEEMFVGVGSRRVRSLFAAAKKKAPCIVFIDEIDAVGGSRKQWDNHSRKTLNQLLVEMDGFEENQGVIVMAATNLQETLDPALTRPGRFDRHVAVPLPDVRGRLDILKYYLQNKPLAPDIDPELIARRTAGFSGAELSNLVNEAALIAAKNNKDTITAYMVDEARDKIMMGVERKSMVLSPESLKLTAYHESGHALVALNTAGAKPIHKATIMPRGHALGMVTMTLDGDREYKITKQQLVADIDVCMGGRVAESIIFGEDQVTSGASSDLQQATRTARGMVMQYGMSDEIGPVYVSGDNTSSETEKKVDAEVGRMLREAYARVQELLTVKEADLHRLARALLEHETLTLNEIKEVLAGTFQRTPIASKTYDVEALLGDVGEMPEPVHQQSPEAPPRS